jgi:hypothetical protein
MSYQIGPEQPLRNEAQNAACTALGTAAVAGQQRQGAIRGASAVDVQQSALDVQVGGGHYKKRAIQPVEYIHANKLNFLEGCVVKRITRWRDKNGIEDLEKIKHEVDLLITLEKKYGANT